LLNYVILFILLFGTWLILSGVFSVLFIGFGILSCLAATIIFAKINKSTSEGSQLLWLLLKLPLYLIWLIKEIVISSLSVSKKIWQLDPEISPDLVWIPTSFKDDISLTILGNSITLTPGTLTTAVRHDGMIQVHTLTKDGIEGIRTVFFGKVMRLVNKKEQKA
jgi:multicomponent Na+:H+ antiporter subunit E